MAWRGMAKIKMLVCYECFSLTSFNDDYVNYNKPLLLAHLNYFRFITRSSVVDSEIAETHVLHFKCK